MNWLVAGLPEIGLALAAMAVLLAGRFRATQRRVRARQHAGPRADCSSPAGLVIIAPQGIGYGGLFVADAFSRFVQVLILAGSALAIILSLDFNRQDEQLARFEFPVLILFATTGMMIMVSATNLMTLYLGLELQSLALYVIASFARDSLRSAEAGLKYFVLGSLASGLLLYGISLTYGFSGSMAFSHIAQALLSGTASVGLIIGMVFVLSGLVFKMAAVPFHMWSPDVYEGAPSSVTALLGSAPKVAAVALLLRVMVQPFGHLLPQWQLLVEIISIASMVLGSLAPIMQTSIKRLMAYSSIGHVGYALMGLAAGTASGTSGTLIYLATYIFMTLGTFGVILAMRRQGRSVEKISDLAGLGRNDGGLALAMSIFMLSMAGVPPLSGLLRQALRVSGGHPERLVDARRDRRRDQHHRRLLLPAHRQDHVFRRAAERLRPPRALAVLRGGCIGHRDAVLHPRCRTDHRRGAGRRIGPSGLNASGPDTDRSLPAAYQLERVASLPSTSDACVERARAGAPDGLAILADVQTAGRGSRGRSWACPPGNLYLSVLLRPRNRAEEAGAGQWALLAGVALIDTLAAFSASPDGLRLKWPNDVLSDGAKLAGILVDAAMTPSGRGGVARHRRRRQSCVRPCDRGPEDRVPCDARRHAARAHGGRANIPGAYRGGSRSSGPCGVCACPGCLARARASDRHRRDD